jgi:protein involved in polysaccharide export with SLBB domain
MNTAGHTAPNPARRFCVAALLLIATTSLGVASVAAQEAESARDVGLHPGDLVRVAIWREPELSGEFIVDSRGVLTLPMIGEQQVTGLTLDEVQARLVERFRVNLRNPAIQITPLRRVEILGYVNRPGIYPVDPTISLSGAIAMAMGANPHGDLRRIRIVRGDQVLLARVSAEQTLAAVDIRSGDRIFVGEKSWFARNSPAVISAAVALPVTIATVFQILKN